MKIISILKDPSTTESENNQKGYVDKLRQTEQAMNMIKLKYRPVDDGSSQ